MRISESLEDTRVTGAHSPMGSYGEILLSLQ